MEAMTFGMLVVSGVFLLAYLRRRRSRLDNAEEE